MELVRWMALGCWVLAAGCSDSEGGAGPSSGGADAGGSGGQDASAGTGGTTGGSGAASGTGGDAGTGATGGASGSGGTAGGGAGGDAGQAGNSGSAGSAAAAGAGGSAGSAGTSGIGGTAGVAGSAGAQPDAGPDGSAGQPPDTASPEICDGIDNDNDGETDEGCDDDNDGYCDANMVFTGSVPACPHGGYDCDDDNADIHPGATTHIEGVDYDCDSKLEYMAEIVISVDDLITRLCVNGQDVLPVGPNAGQWPYADTYNVVLESGDNVVGVSGRDTGLTISAFVATITVNNTTYITDGVDPPANGVAYTSAAPEWNQTKWRYYPTEVGNPDVTWCDVAFDDSEWGPAIIAKSANCAADPDLGDIGHCPWNFHDCGGGETRCPSDFIPYYEDGVVDNEPVWVWDYNPVDLADAWFRHRITLP